jgi:hypothetical protein
MGGTAEVVFAVTGGEEWRRGEEGDVWAYSQGARQILEHGEAISRPLAAE